MINLTQDFRKVIRHFNQKIQTENGFEKTEKYLIRQENVARERRHRSDDFSGALTGKREKSLADEVRETITGGCEATETHPSADDELQVYCDWNNDTVLCWPRAFRGTTVYLPCFEEYNGVKYDSSGNASRHCFENGTWSSSNYSLCLNIETTISESAFDDNITGLTSMLYYIGYSISVVALLVAMFIFLYFKDLRCLRNTIHTNLMFTYVMADFMWILTGILQNSLQADMTMCMVLPLMLHYFHVTTFFWMFVEGFYLYMLVVETFNRANIKAYVYVSIGWGIPLLLIIIWGIVKALAPLHEETVYDSIAIIITSIFVHEERNYFFGNATQPRSTTLIEPDTISPTTMVYNILLLIGCCCGLVSSFLLIYGLMKDNRVFLIPWILTVFIKTVIDVSHSFYLVILAARRLNPVHIILFTLDFFLLVLTIYAFLCVVSQYQEYKAGRGRAEDDALRYPVSHLPAPTATSCLSTRKPGTYHETTATEPHSTMVTNDYGGSSPFQPARKPSANTKHVQFGITEAQKQPNGNNLTLW